MAFRRGDGRRRFIWRATLVNLRSKLIASQLPSAAHSVGRERSIRIIDYSCVSGAVVAPKDPAADDRGMGNRRYFGRPIRGRRAGTDDGERRK